MRYKIVSWKPLLILATVTVLLAGGFFAWKKYRTKNVFEEEQKTVWEALVNIVDQKTADPAEDARASLKSGDVIAVFPEGHAWSETEKSSYLIVKFKAKKEDADKLLQSETKETKREGMDQPEAETVRARKYHIDMGEIGAKDIEVNDLAGGQPLQDKVFDEDVIEEK